jgi:2-polyprenyl-3-methyl-5-hydroxy-6-metoxy-1,4-benzoquinol methylase
MYRGLTDRLFGAPGVWNLRRCSAQGCGTYWLDPKPVDEDLVKLYRQYYTHEERSEHGAGALRRRLERASSRYLRAKYGYAAPELSVLERIVGFILRVNPVWSANLDFSVFYLPAKPRGQLLEIGCGAGAMLETMASRGWQAVGVDFDQSAVAIARSRGRSVHPGGVFEQNFPDESFDAIVMNHVIEHVSAPRELLTECKRILRKGGALVIITPNPGGFLHWLFGKDWRGLEPPRHLHLFSLAALSKLASAAGFSGVQTRTTVHGAPHFWFASRQLRRHGAGAMHIRPTMAHRIVAHTVAFGLGLLNAIVANRGEESVLICTRPKHGD